ncbi:MAG: toll/interleukin-1 receptor domain-containing protein [Clostridia bacterium]|nr:toll/interleukin-1 receptor domain-containing protein [Clostridia bacterium]
MTDLTNFKINLKETESGDFDFFTRALEEDEKKFYGIFISHSNADNEEYLFPLRDEMKKLGLHPLCDRDLLSGGDDFQVKIESSLDCYAAVIIVTEASLASDWVNCEMGILSGRNIPIFIWDPKEILTYNNAKHREFINLHFEDYLPAYKNMDELLVKLKGASPYSEMFCEENEFLGAEEFTERMNERVDTVIATLESEIFEEHYASFADCKIGMLIPNFGMFYEGHADGEHCFAKRGAELENFLCPISQRHCALHPTRVLGEENKECVLLNHVIYNGKLMRKGEIDRRGVEAEVGSIVFNVPVHRYFGTEFKIIIDVPGNKHYDAIFKMLENAGMNPTGPASMVGGRIYLSLPSRKRQGLFRLVHQFENNFLCPHAARKK